MDNNLTTVDEFINSYPSQVQNILQKIRKIILEIAPSASEKISYGIPTFTLNGKNLVHFSAYKSHIGFYPGPTAIEIFKDKLQNYETSKGTIKFPIDKPIPYDLIDTITAYLVSQKQIPR